MSKRIFEEDSDVGAFTSLGLVHNGSKPTSHIFKTLADANNRFHMKWGAQASMIGGARTDAESYLDGFNPAILDYHDGGVAGTAVASVTVTAPTTGGVAGQYRLRINRPLVALGGTAWPDHSDRWIVFTSGRCRNIAFKCLSVFQDATNNYLSTFVMSPDFPVYFETQSAGLEMMVPEAGDTYIVVPQQRTFPLFWHPGPNVAYLRFIVGAGRRYWWSCETVDKSSLDLDDELGITITAADTAINDAGACRFDNRMVPNQIPRSIFIGQLKKDASSTTTSLVLEEDLSPGIEQQFPGIAPASSLQGRYPYNNDLNGCIVTLIYDEGGGACQYQTRKITAWTKSTATLTVPALSSTPGAGSANNVVAVQIFDHALVNTRSSNVVLDSGDNPIDIGTAGASSSKPRPLAVIDSAGTGEQFNISVPFDLSINYILVQEVDKTDADVI